MIVLKISPRNQHDVHETLRQVLSEHALDELQGKLTLVDRNKYRIVNEQGKTLIFLKK